MLAFRPVVVMLALALASSPALAALPAWKIDPAHSSAEFAIKHFALSNVKGTLPVESGTIDLAAGKDIPSSVEAVLDVAQLDTKNDLRNADLRSASWFQTGTYPTATFTSTKIVGTDPNAFTITGNLTLHGVTKPVSLQAHLEGKGQGGRGEKRVAYSAVGTINRRDFALVDSHTNALGSLVVGDDAAISIEVEAVAP